MSETKKPAIDVSEPQVFVVVQEGGSSTEIYAAAFDTEDDAKAYRDSCEEGAYRTSKPVPVPRSLADHPGFSNFVHDLLSASINVGYPHDDE